MPVVFGSEEVVMIKNIVLVHGGFVDGSGWQGVYDLLKKGQFEP